MLRTPTSLNPLMPPAEAYLLGWGDCEAERDRAEREGVQVGAFDRQLAAALERVRLIAPWDDPEPELEPEAAPFDQEEEA